MKSRVFLFTSACVAVLAACQGVSSVPPRSFGAVPHREVAMTTGWGRVVDDTYRCTNGSQREAPACTNPSGAPLANVPVALEPWKPCYPQPHVRVPNPPAPTRWPQPERLVCPRAITATTTDARGRFTLRAPPGHYVLVIGSDSAADLARPTIHDNVTLAGSVQHLTAPTPCPAFHPSVRYEHCLQQIPMITPNPVERSGDYRLTTIDVVYEKPCVVSFDEQRAQRNVEPVVVDEWMTENTRNEQRWVANPKFTPAPFVWNGWPRLSTGFASNQGGSIRQVDGHPGCWTWNIAGAFFYNVDALPYSIDPRTHWFSGFFGQWYKRGASGNTLGDSQYLRDPRSARDPNVPVWP
ncbi:MAG: carboxypeptidase regulatory-like domain-containing protein [Candidatus Eremiobacteraeota bacterium]|nr:carboxypeptidase regulatory-like domain-containing protein [Candidatus Eremiobacteraeota bacterium]